jgi:hypothetical protein
VNNTHPERVLERLDAGAHRRLRDAHTPGRAGETSFLQHRQEGALVVPIGNVVAMARDSAPRVSDKAGPLARAAWVLGDAMNANDVRRAAEGVQAIVHAVNPPGYPHRPPPFWRRW